MPPVGANTGGEFGAEYHVPETPGMDDVRRANTGGGGVWSGIPHPLRLRPGEEAGVHAHEAPIPRYLRGVPV